MLSEALGLVKVVRVSIAVGVTSSSAPETVVSDEPMLDDISGNVDTDLRR